MKRTKEEKAAARETFRRLSFRQKAEHIWTYYKWPILLSIALIWILGAAVDRQLHKKDPVLYLGLVNVNLGQDMIRTLTDGYVEHAGLDSSRSEVFLYSGIYISEDAQGDAHRSSYASQIKLMASIEGQQMDVVLMSRQSYDLLSSQGFLLPIGELCASDPALSETLGPWIRANSVIVTDNNIEYLLGEADQRQTETQEVRNSLALDALPLTAEAFDEPAYLGFLANTPRRDSCLAYVRYLAEADKQP